LGILQSQKVAYTAHRQSLGWYGGSWLIQQPKPMPFDCRSNLPTIPWNDCPTSRGIRAHHPVEHADIKRGS
jgi:hypothetical protein